MKGSLSERHKEKKKKHGCQALALLDFLLFMPIFMIDGNEVCVQANMCASLSHCAEHFSEQNDNLQVK